MEQAVAITMKAKGAEFKTFGTMDLTRDCVALLFRLDDADFVFNAYDGHLTVTRCGDLNYDIHIDEGETTPCSVDTALGSFPAHITGERVSIKRGKAVELLVKYALHWAGNATPMQIHLKAEPQSQS